MAILSLPVNIFSDYDWTLCLNIFQSAEVTDENGDQVEASVEDNDDGTYRISFTAKSVGTHCLNIQIFDMLMLISACTCACAAVKTRIFDILK